MQFYTQIYTQKVLTFYMRNNGFQRAGVSAFSKQHESTLLNSLSYKVISTKCNWKIKEIGEDVRSKTEVLCNHTLISMAVNVKGYMSSWTVSLDFN